MSKTKLILNVDKFWRLFSDIFDPWKFENHAGLPASNNDLDNSLFMTCGSELWGYLYSRWVERVESDFTITLYLDCNGQITEPQWI